MFEDQERVAKTLYRNYANNHPTVQAHNFSEWDQLPQAAKDEWMKKARKRIEHDEDDCC